MNRIRCNDWQRKIREFEIKEIVAPLSLFCIVRSIFFMVRISFDFFFFFLFGTAKKVFSDVFRIFRFSKNNNDIR